MRIVLSDFISLDGVIQAPGGADEDTDGGFENGGWSMPFFDPEAMGPAIGEVMEKTEALLFGRRTWQTMAAAWPGRAGDPFADRMNEIPKYVASRTLTQDDLDWANSTLLPADDVLGAVRELKAKSGRDIQVMGCASLASQLISDGLVDEYRLMIEPIVLGGGKQLFPEDGQARTLELVSCSTSSTGVQICTYRPAGTEREHERADRPQACGPARGPPRRGCRRRRPRAGDTVPGVHSRRPARSHQGFRARLHGGSGAWDEPAAWTGATAAGGVDLPAEVAGVVVLDELLIHGWDLAMATGQPATYDGPGLEAVYGMVKQFRAGGIEGLFGPEVPVPEDAPLMDRTGRRRPRPWMATAGLAEAPRGHAAV